MGMTPELLQEMLKDRFHVAVHGRGMASIKLPMPVFYQNNMILKDGRVYIVRLKDLPDRIISNCMLICLGSVPKGLYNSYDSTILFIEDDGVDIISLFNIVADCFNQVNGWEDSLEQIITNGGDVEELVRISIPILQNCITVSDYNLRILVNCDVKETEETRHVIITHEHDQIPVKISSKFIADFAKQSSYRTPFFIQGQEENPNGDNYCINLFNGNTYLGCCTLWDKYRPMKQSDYLLFQIFTTYVKRIITSSFSAQKNHFVTMKSVFEDLLEGFPVSNEEYTSAAEMLKKNLALRNESFAAWYCIVISSANKNKILPMEYLCTSLEELFPYSNALSYENNLVCFCLLKENEEPESIIQDTLKPYLKDMNFRSGISETFTNVYHARDYYLQALSILNTGIDLAPEQYVYRFSDYILPYMLRHCVGEFKPNMIFSKGLKELKEISNLDYMGTLKQYLDNECNASRTAQDLFLHRSSLLPRLEKMKEYIELETPEQRLYLRICIYLLELQEHLSNH